jgi:hypothetical protein
MQTNTVKLGTKKTSKGDVSGNTVCTPLGSTYTASTGGKSTVGHRLETAS